VKASVSHSTSFLSDSASVFNTAVLLSVAIVVGAGVVPGLVVGCLGVEATGLVAVVV